MIQKKICMLGSFAVGKTSLVRQFVASMFDERYHTTVGVKIDKKVVKVADTDVTLMLWDMHGEDEFQKLRLSYLRGSHGYFIVVDGTRPKTLDRAQSLQDIAAKTAGDVPFVLLVNKADLTSEWAVEEASLSAMEADGWQIIKTSAKSGLGVEEAFSALASRMVQP